MRTHKTILHEQESDHAAIDEAVTKCRRAIAGIDKNLKPEIVRERAKEISERTVADIGSRRKPMLDRVAEARRMMRRFSPESARRRARFHEASSTDGILRLAAFETLKRTATGELLEHLHDALEDKNLALAELVRLEFQARSDKAPFVQSFVDLFSRVEVPAEAVEEPRADLERVAQLERLSEAAMLQLLGGGTTGLETLAMVGRNVRAEDLPRNDDPKPAPNPTNPTERLAAFRASKKEEQAS
jgi:hypothetical protein